MSDSQNYQVVLCPDMCFSRLCEIINELQRLTAKDCGIHGVFSGYEHPEQFRDKRVLVVEFDQKSVDFALELTKVTGRVILSSPLQGLSVNDESKTEVKLSDIKHLKQAELVEVSGGFTVEKVRIHDLDEAEEYDLVVDAVVVPS